jgi:hypothetical protein
VIHSLSAQLGDELDLKIGQLVRVTHIIDKDWYRSACETGTGQFVRLVQRSVCETGTGQFVRLVQVDL